RPARALPPLERTLDLAITPSESALRDRAFALLIQTLVEIGREDEARARVRDALVREPDLDAARRWAPPLGVARP
ncbi:MAG: hypothetical protein AB7P00_37730, partial [Sandaracinaceae bacterium]